MDNNEEFSMFANSPRVTSKQAEATKKSPFTSASHMIKETYETPIKAEPQIHHIQQEVHTSHIVQNREEEISNVGTELQKFRKYPTRSFDKCINKMVAFNEEEYFLVREFAADISMARKKSTIKNKDTLPRITENTIIRTGMRALLKHIGNKKIDLNQLQTEEALSDLFNSILR